MRYYHSWLGKSRNSFKEFQEGVSGHGPNPMPGDGIPHYKVRIEDHLVMSGIVK